jgi:hypothetical protein
MTSIDAGQFAVSEAGAHAEPRAVAADVGGISLGVRRPVGALASTFVASYFVGRMQFNRAALPWAKAATDRRTPKG